MIVSPWPTHLHGRVFHQVLLARNQRQSAHRVTPGTRRENATTVSAHTHTHTHNEITSGSPSNVTESNTDEVYRLLINI